MENFETYKLDQTGQQTQAILDQVSTNTADIEQLRALYEALTQREPVIIQPSDTWPVADPQENVIYRVIDRVNTPPQSYSDYMWNGTAMVLMATYNNAIDNEPTPGSNNLVKSGGVAASIVFDISAYHATGSTLATYADLASALGTDGANVPASVRKGGMSVKFVKSSDNKYVQYRLMANTWSTTVADWQGVDDEPTAGSDSLVKSRGIKNAIQTVDDRITDFIGGFLERETTKGPDYLNVIAGQGYPAMAWDSSINVVCLRLEVTTGKTYKITASGTIVLGFTDREDFGSGQLNIIDGIPYQANNEIEFTYTENYKYVIFGGNITDAAIYESVSGTYEEDKEELEQQITNLDNRIDSLDDVIQTLDDRIESIDSGKEAIVTILNDTGFTDDIIIGYFAGHRTYKIHLIKKHYNVTCSGNFKLGYSNTDAPAATATYLNLVQEFTDSVEIVNPSNAYLYIEAAGSDIPVNVLEFTDDTELYLGNLNTQANLQLQKENELLRMNYEALKDKVDSMLSLKSGKTQTSVNINLRNSNSKKLILNLHKRQNTNTAQENDVFLPNANNDFSDIRVIGSNGQYLPYKFINKGDYDIVPCSTLGTGPTGKIWQNSHGQLFVISNLTSGWPAVSNDGGATWQTLNGIYEGLKWGIISFLSKDDTLFLSLDGVLYRSEYPYNTKEQVLDIRTDGGVTYTGCFILSTDICQHPDGELFLGSYQTENSIRIFKSSDDGRTWTKVHESNDYQHVHNIMCDDSQTPAVIYAGCDHSNGVYYSADKGVTWKDLRQELAQRDIILPTAVDYGVIYAEAGFRLMGGETATNGGHSIIRTTDNENFTSVLSCGQSCYMCERLGDTLFAGLLSADSHLNTQIIVSKDNGLKWQSAYSTMKLAKWGTSDGFRYVQKIKEGTEDILIFGCQTNGNMMQDSVKVYSNNAHFAQIVVEVPYGVSSVTVEDGYLLSNDANIYNDYEYSVIPNNRIMQFLFGDNVVKELVTGMNFFGNYRTGEPLKKLGNYVSPIVFGNRSLKIDNETVPFEINSLNIGWRNAVTISFWLRCSSYTCKFAILDDIIFDAAHIKYDVANLYAEYMPSLNTANRYDIILDFQNNKISLHVNGDFADNGDTSQQSREVTVNFDSIKALNKHTLISPIEIEGDCFVSDLRILGLKLSDTTIADEYWSKLDDNKN